MKRILVFIAAAVLCIVSGCSPFNYKNVTAGELEGSVVVLWVGNRKGGGGSRFAYVPMPGNALKFKFKSTQDNEYEILPEPIYTDGGSIPRAAQLFNGFGPWDYAPAYIVHDWLFFAKRCLNADEGNPVRDEIETMQFTESAEAIASVIKSLVIKGIVDEDRVAPAIISGTVTGPWSRSKWENDKDCHTGKLSPEHQKLVDDFTRSRTTRTFGALRATPQAGPRVVAVISYDN